MSYGFSRSDISNKNVGTYTISITNYSGNNNPNYDISVEAGTLTIEKTDLYGIIIKVDDAINKTNDLVLSLIKQMKGEQIK